MQRNTLVANEMSGEGGVRKQLVEKGRLVNGVVLSSQANQQIEKIYEINPLSNPA